MFFHVEHPALPGRLRRLGLAALLLGLALTLPAQPLRLRAGTFDPLDAATQTPGQTAQLATAARGSKLLPGERRVMILQWSQPPDEAALAALDAAGVRRVAPLPEQAWIVTVPPELDVQQVLGVDPAGAARPGGGVRWAAGLAPDWKLSPELAPAPAHAARADAKSDADAEPEVGRYHVQLAETGALKAARERLNAVAGRIDFHSRQTESEIWTIETTRDQAMALAQENAVVWIEAAPRPQLNGEREGLFLAGALDEQGSCLERPGGSYGDWLAAVGLSGTGQVVHMMDDGLSQGIATNQPGTAHPDLLGRIAGIDNATREASGESVGGHGTLNASILMGTPRAGGGALTDTDGYLLGQGVAPEAQIYATRIFNAVGDYDVGGRTLQQLVQPAYQAGARISSNSWNAISFGAYTADSLEIDALTRDVDDQTPGDQAMLFVFSAGNARGGQTIGSPASAKNLICVGALENCDGGVMDGCGNGPEASDSMLDVAGFQSRGPTADGRLSPTLTAPGVHVTGAASDSPRFDATGVCARESAGNGEPAGARRYYPPGQTFYTWSSGTSHSTPAVAGGAALLREYFQIERGIDPSPALLKAALISGATDPRGGRLNDGTPLPLGPIPNMHVGWGRADLARVIDRSSVNFFIDQTERFTPQRLEFTQELQVTSSNAPLRIVLCWTDALGALNAQRALVNDLDLELSDGTHTWLGNVFADGASATGGSADRLNNSEVILLPAPQPGIYTITVRAAVLAADGVPNVAGALDQDFALFVANGNGQSRQGRVAFDRETLGCGARSVVSVADMDLAGSAPFSITLTSRLTGDREQFVLSEQGINTGVFRGEFETTSDGSAVGFSGDGLLSVLDEDTVTAIYLDQDPGDGAAPREAIATLRVDCAPPRLIDLETVELADGRAVIELRTDEPSQASLRWDGDCGTLNQHVASKEWSTTHRLELNGLPSCGLVAYQVELTDANGNRAIVGEEDCLLLQTLERVVSFSDTFDPQPQPGWTHGAALGADRWWLTAHAGSGAEGQAWLATAAAAPGDSWLLSPAVWIEPGTRLSFRHAFAFEAIGLNEGFDGGVLELTTDGGATWIDLGPYLVEGGYNATLARATGNPLGGRGAWSGGEAGRFRRVVADLAPFAGQTVQVRFRMGSDRSLGGGTWTIDDVEFARTQACLGSLAGLSPKSPRFGCAATSIRVLVLDRDLALEAAGPDAAPDAGAFSMARFPAEMVVPALPESIRRVDDSGVFEIEFRVEPAGEPGRVRVAGAVELRADESLLIFYDDPQTPLGPRRSSNRVQLDCSAPQLVDVHSVEVGEHTARIAVVAEAPVRIELKFGTECGLPERTVHSGPAAATHVLQLGDLEPCTTYFYRLRLIDEAGNTAEFDNDGACYGLRTAQPHAHVDTLDPQPGPGWTTGASANEQAWRLTASPWASSPPQAWEVESVGRVKDAWLETPPFDVDTQTALGFMHTHALEAGFDGGVLEITTDGGATWRDLKDQITQGAYNGTIATAFGSPLGGRAAWTGGALGPMRPVRVELGAFVGEGRRVRFRLGCDRTGPAGSWLVDDLRIETSPLCGPQFPDAPLLLLPEAKKTGVQFTGGVGFSWQAAPFTEVYRIRLGMAPGALEPIGEIAAPATQFTVDGLKAGTRYFWQVVAVNAQGAAPSALRSFRTQPIAQDALVDHLLGLPDALSEAEQAALDYDGNGTLDTADLVTQINRAE